MVSLDGKGKSRHRKPRGVLPSKIKGISHRFSKIQWWCEVPSFAPGSPGPRAWNPPGIDAHGVRSLHDLATLGRGPVAKWGQKWDNSWAIFALSVKKGLCYGLCIVKWGNWSSSLLDYDMNSPKCMPFKGVLMGMEPQDSRSIHLFLAGYHNFLFGEVHTVRCLKPTFYLIKRNMSWSIKTITWLKAHVCHVCNDSIKVSSTTSKINLSYFLLVDFTYIYIIYIYNIYIYSHIKQVPNPLSVGWF